MEVEVEKDAAKRKKEINIIQCFHKLQKNNY